MESGEMVEGGTKKIKVSGGREEVKGRGIMECVGLCRGDGGVEVGGGVCVVVMG